MPYEYRKLTTEEREKVLSQRRELGYPLHASPHPVRDAGRYLISAANFEHVPIMASPHLDAGGRGWLREIWRMYPPGDDFGDGWDD